MTGARQWSPHECIGGARQWRQQIDRKTLCLVRAYRSRGSVVWARLSFGALRPALCGFALSSHPQCLRSVSKRTARTSKLASRLQWDWPAGEVWSDDQVSLTETQLAARTTSSSHGQAEGSARPALTDKCLFSRAAGTRREAIQAAQAKRKIEHRSEPEQKIRRRLGGSRL